MDTFYFEYLSANTLICILGVFMLTSHLWCTIYTLFILGFFFATNDTYNYLLLNPIKKKLFIIEYK